MTSRRQHRVSRRLFLSDFGKGTLAVAVLGAGVMGCSSDSVTSSSSTTTPGSDGENGNDTDTNSTTAADTGSNSGTQQLQWERANLGFVSAYVLARGNEVAIVDTGTDGDTTKISEALNALSLSWSDPYSTTPTRSSCLRFPCCPP